MLKSFASWFRSPAGIWQTIGMVVLVVLYETVFPSTDPHGFWLLYWLTVYSAVTQPILAYVADLAGRKTDNVLNEELRLLRESHDNQVEELKLLREELQILRRLEKKEEDDQLGRHSPM